MNPCISAGSLFTDIVQFDFESRIVIHTASKPKKLSLHPPDRRLYGYGTHYWKPGGVYATLDLCTLARPRARNRTNRKREYAFYSLSANGKFCTASRYRCMASVSVRTFSLKLTAQFA